MHRRRAVVACPPVIYYADDGEQESFVKHRLLGYGGFAAVYEVERVSDGCRMAAKVLPLRSLADANKLRRVQNEIDINQLLHHQHVVTFLGSFQDEHNVYLLQELCCITLSDLLKHVGRMSEVQVAHILWQVLSALEHLHGCRVAHRDLKLSNMFLARDGTVKVGDLGLACHLPTPSSRRRSTCGSLNWMAPEVLRPGQHGYGLEVDVWAVGVMLFTLLVGWPPFAVAAAAGHNGEEGASSTQMTCACILQGRYRMPGSDELALGPEVHDLVARLLVVDPAARPSLQQLKTHAFFRKHLGALAAVPVPLLQGGMPSVLEQVPQPSTEQLQIHLEGGSWAESHPGGAAFVGGSGGGAGDSQRPTCYPSLQLPSLTAASDIRLLLNEVGLAALAASAACGGGGARDSTSGSYMEFSQSEQFSVVTVASTSTTIHTATRAGLGTYGSTAAAADVDFKWPALAPPDALCPRFSRNSHHDQVRNHSQSQCLPYRVSDHVTGSTAFGGLRSIRPLSKLLSHSSVADSPQRDPLMSTFGTEPGYNARSPSTCSLTQGTGGPFPLAEGVPTDRLMQYRFFHNQPQPHHEQPTVGLAEGSAQPPALQPNLEDAFPLVFTTRVATVSPGGGGGGGSYFHPSPSVAHVSRTQGLLAAAAASTTVVAIRAPGLPHSGLQPPSPWPDQENSAACSSLHGPWAPPERHLSMLRTAMSLSRHASTAVSTSRSNSQRSSAFGGGGGGGGDGGGGGGCFPNAPPYTSNPCYPHLDQQPRLRQPLSRSPLPGRRRNTVDSMAVSGVSNNQAAPAAATENVDTCEVSNGTGSTEAAGLHVLQSAFLTQYSFHQANASHVRRLRASRSAHARDSMRIAAGLRSVPGGSGLEGAGAEETENDGSIDTTRSFADSLEAMLLGGNSRHAAAVVGGATLMRSSPAPIAASGIDRNTHGYVQATSCGFPSGLAGAPAAPSVPAAAPIILRHARSSLGAPSVSRCGAAALDAPAAVLPTDRSSGPATDCQGKLSAPTPQALPVASLPAPEPQSQPQSQQHQQSQQHEHPSHAPKKSTSATTTPQHSEPLSLAFFAIPQSKILPHGTLSPPPPSGQDSSVLDAGLCICSAADGPVPDNLWSGELSRVRLLGLATPPMLPAGVTAACVLTDAAVVVALEAAQEVAASGVSRGASTTTVSANNVSASATSSGRDGFAADGSHNSRASLEMHIKLQLRSQHKHHHQPHVPSHQQPQECNSEQQQQQQRVASEVTCGALDTMFPECEPSHVWAMKVHEGGRIPVGPVAGCTSALATAAAAATPSEGRSCAADDPCTLEQDSQRYCSGQGGADGGGGRQGGGAGAAECTQQSSPERSTSAMDLPSGRCSTEPAAPCPDPGASSTSSLTSQSLSKVKSKAKALGALGVLHFFRKFRSGSDSRVKMCQLKEEKLQLQRCLQAQQERQQQQQYPLSQQEQQWLTSHEGSGAGISLWMHMHPWRSMALCRLQQQAMQLHRIQRVETEAKAGVVQGHTKKTPESVDEWDNTSSCSAISSMPPEPLLMAQGTSCKPSNPVLQTHDHDQATAAGSTAVTCSYGNAYGSTWSASAVGSVAYADRPAEVSMALAPHSGKVVGDVAASGGVAIQRAVDAGALLTRGRPMQAAPLPGTSKGAAVAATAPVGLQLPWSASAADSTSAAPSRATAGIGHGGNSGAAWPEAAAGARLGNLQRSSRKNSSSGGWSIDRLGLCCPILPGHCGSSGPHSVNGAKDAVQKQHSSTKDTSRRRAGAASAPTGRRFASLDVERVLRHLESSDPDDVSGTAVGHPPGVHMAEVAPCSTISACATSDGGNTSPQASHTPAARRSMLSARASVAASSPATPGSLQSHSGPASARFSSRFTHDVTVSEILEEPSSLLVNESDGCAAHTLPTAADCGAELKPTCVNVLSRHDVAGGRAPGSAGFYPPAGRDQTLILEMAAEYDGPNRAGGLERAEHRARIAGDSVVLPTSADDLADKLRHQGFPEFTSGTELLAGLAPPRLLEGAMCVLAAAGEEGPHLRASPLQAEMEPLLQSRPAITTVVCGLQNNASASAVTDSSCSAMASEMAADALAELASRLRSKSVKDGLAGSRTASFTYKPSRMMPAAHRSPTRRTAVGVLACSGVTGPASPRQDGVGGSAVTARGGTVASAVAELQPSMEPHSTGDLRFQMHPREVLMVRWLDFSSKYGLSYVLSNGTIGVLFRDGTQLLWDRADAYAWLLGPLPEDAGSHTDALQQLPPQSQPVLLKDHPAAANTASAAGAMSISAAKQGMDQPHDVQKKLRLLRSFEGMLLGGYGDGDGLSGPQAEGDAATSEVQLGRQQHSGRPDHWQHVEQDPWDTGRRSGAPEGTQAGGLLSSTAATRITAAALPLVRLPSVFVLWWSRTKKALVVCMSSGTLQALFSDGSELVVREAEDEVDYLARDGCRTSCRLRAALQGPKTSVYKRINYATMLMRTRNRKQQ